MSTLTTNPPLVRTREVLEKQREDDNMEGFPWESLDRVSQGTQDGVDGVGRQLQGLRHLKVQEITVIYTLKVRTKLE